MEAADSGEAVADSGEAVADLVVREEEEDLAEDSAEEAMA